eukprot:gene8371-10284_t
MYIYEELKISILPTSSDPVTIPKGSIPNSVEILGIYCPRPQELHREDETMIQVRAVLEAGTIPHSVKVLRLDHLLFKHDPKRLIPDSVEELLVYSWCSENWDDEDGVRDNDGDLVPKSVKYLEIQSSWDSGTITSFESLPQGIVDLKLANIQIEFPRNSGFVPSQKLKSLEMGYSLEGKPLEIAIQMVSLKIVHQELSH